MTITITLYGVLLALGYLAGGLLLIALGLLIGIGLFGFRWPG